VDDDTDDASDGWVGPSGSLNGADDARHVLGDCLDLGTADCDRDGTRVKALTSNDVVTAATTTTATALQSILIFVCLFSSRKDLYQSGG